MRCFLDEVSVTTIPLQAGSINRGGFSPSLLSFGLCCFFNLTTTATTWYHQVGNRTSEIMRCKVYLEKRNGRVEVQLRAACVLAGCHSLGEESIKFCFGVYPPFLCKWDSGVHLTRSLGVNLLCCRTNDEHGCLFVKWEHFLIHGT